jgi:hypothetical protein
LHGVIYFRIAKSRPSALAMLRRRFVPAAHESKVDRYLVLTSNRNLLRTPFLLP